MSRWSWIVSVLAVVGCAAACGKDADAVTGGPARTTATLAKGEIKDRVLLTGELKAGAATDIAVPKTEAWEVAIRWMAEDGAQVKAGDRILEFDNSAFTTGLVQKQIAVTEAASAMHVQRDVSAMAIAVKGFELEQAKVALDKATLLAAVPPDLLPQKQVQDRQIEKTRAELARTKAEKDLATEKQSAALDARIKQIELDKAKRAVETAENSIAQLDIKAPKDGVVSINNHPWEGRRFQVGDSVQPGFTIITIPDFSKPMEIRAELSDVDDGRLAVGAKGTCTLDAYPKEPMPCEVTELAPVARNNKRQSLRRMFAVSLAMSNSDPARMRPGMSVKVDIPVGVKTGVVAPRGALVFDKDKAALRLSGGELREVTLGACDAQACVIEAGANEGDTVAVGAP